MREALALAREAAGRGEVPVGAVVVRGGQVIGRGFDSRIGMTDPAAHAEIVAMREAARVAGDWRLEDVVLYVTLEPCAMCAGAALLARVPLVVYGAPNPKFGAVESIINMYDSPRWNHHVETLAGVLAAECAEVLSGFFRDKRSGR